MVIESEPWSFKSYNNLLQLGEVGDHRQKN
jgi:hypothetical protein